MACDYQEIRRENERSYGTEIGRVGQILLADRYDDRTHFIYELLQNAEDALAKRAGWCGKRSVRFDLCQETLRFSHFGKPFDEQDVRGICGIAESTKVLAAIGRFGIGFKSVYAFTDQPEIHSGEESFAIESFVWPKPVQKIQNLNPDETRILLPLCDPSNQSEIEAGLKRIGGTSLLFLREIEEIEWEVEGGRAGLYLRNQPEFLADSVRRITVIGQTTNEPVVEESWLVFSKPVSTEEEKFVGYVESAFRLLDDKVLNRPQLSPVTRSPLVVFFPTVLETHFGFLVQGPYRTTPSRDNVPGNDEWNRHCVNETAVLLREALLWLRDNGYLDAEALKCLPLKGTKFAEGDMFNPIFKTVRSALTEEDLLPKHGGGHVCAKQARLARTKELRELFEPDQLTQLFQVPQSLAWLSGELTQDRTPELFDYLVKELHVEEIRPERLLSRLNAIFLESQSDEWIRRLYEFLADQKALYLRACELPLVRLENGKHVRAMVNAQPQAYIPGEVATGFPTVRRSTCSSKSSLEFLSALGLNEPDLVDDIIVNVLPRYCFDILLNDIGTYTADIERILRAYRTDSDSRRKRLVEGLRDAYFVACREQGENLRQMAKPKDVYLATEKLSQLFSGVKGVSLVDSDFGCLKGEDVRTLLLACGSRRYLEPVPIRGNHTLEQRCEIRRKAGLERAGWEYPIEDLMVRGLEDLLRLIPMLNSEEKKARARYLWDALIDLEYQKGSNAFLATYTWSYSHETKTALFDSSFLDLLNQSEWVPDADGNLCKPELILFDSLGWKPNPFLLSKIKFKPPIIDQLAREVGIEPGVLDLLKKLGVTSEAELRMRMGISEEAPITEADDVRGVDDALKNLGITDLPTSPVPDPATGVSPTSGGHDSSSTGGHSPGTSSTKRTPGSSGGRTFISYVGVHSDDEGDDSDGTDHTSRMALEEKAIALIRTREPQWQSTSANNPGFDLFKAGPDGKPATWCEVKAMTGSLEDRPVGLSRTQFECALEHGNDYWLYIVEHTVSETARIVRIQDPAGKARTFTFDRGWLNVAEVEPDLNEMGE